MTTPSDAGRAGEVHRRPYVLADVLSDHRPDQRPNGLVGCSCGEVHYYEWPDWRLHVGHAQAIALDEDATHAASHGCTTPTDPEATL